MKTLLLAAFTLLLSVPSFAGKDGVLHSDKSITWLGIDFTQAKFIGTATQWKDAGEITDEQMRDKYCPAWNDLFITEQSRYDVAKYINRPSVSYATDVTKRANNSIRTSLFTDDPNNYERLSESDISALVKKYNFQGKTGVGMLFFVEGMSKGKAEVAAWVTFVDMNTRTVLETRRIEGTAGGFGFKNYWAKGFLNILKEVSDKMD